MSRRVLVSQEESAPCFGGNIQGDVMSACGKGRSA